MTKMPTMAMPMLASASKSLMNSSKSKTICCRKSSIKAMISMCLQITFRIRVKAPMLIFTPGTSSTNLLRSSKGSSMIITSKLTSSRHTISSSMISLPIVWTKIRLHKFKRTIMFNLVGTNRFSLRTKLKILKVLRPIHLHLAGHLPTQLL